MPSQIAELFFFDGEKLEGLADPIRSANLLRSGIYSLLGINSIDNLIKSLSQLEKKKLLQTASNKQTNEVITNSGFDNEEDALNFALSRIYDEDISNNIDLNFTYPMIDLTQFAYDDVGARYAQLSSRSVTGSVKFFSFS